MVRNPPEHAGTQVHPGPSRSPHAMGQLGLCSTTAGPCAAMTEPPRLRACAPQQRKTLRAATKTQRSTLPTDKPTNPGSADLGA